VSLLVWLTSLEKSSVEHQSNFESYDHMTKNSVTPSAANVSPTTSSAAQILAQTQMVAQAAQASQSNQQNLFRTQSLPIGNIANHFSAFQIASAMTQPLPPSPGLIGRPISASHSPEPPSEVLGRHAFLEDGLSGLSTRTDDSDQQ